MNVPTPEQFARQFPRFAEVWESAKLRPDYNRERFHAAVYLIFLRKMARIGMVTGQIPDGMGKILTRGLEGIAASLMEAEVTGPGGDFEGSLFSMLEKCISSDMTDMIQAKGRQQ